MSSLALTIEKFLDILENTISNFDFNERKTHQATKQMTKFNRNPQKSILKWFNENCITDSFIYASNGDYLVQYIIFDN